MPNFSRVCSACAQYPRLLNDAAARRAQINERSSVLRCYLGMALAKVGKAGEALGCLGEAIAADPANPLAKFERAGVLLGLERFHDALAELEALRVRALAG